VYLGACDYSIANFRGKTISRFERDILSLSELLTMVYRRISPAAKIIFLTLFFSLSLFLFALLLPLLKRADQLEWVRHMNNIRNRVEEVLLSEIIYR